MVSGWIIGTGNAYIQGARGSDVMEAGAQGALWGGVSGFAMMGLAPLINEFFNIPWTTDYSGSPSNGYEVSLGEAISRFTGRSVSDYIAQQGMANAEVILTSYSSVLIGGEHAPTSAYTLRGDDVGWRTLWSEFRKGIGPERSLFRDGHSMVEKLKTSWIVTEARTEFLLAGGNKSLLYWDAPYGLVGNAFSFSMTEQFIGGARITIIPTSRGLYYQIDDTKDRYSLFLHSIKNNPSRVRGQIIPYSTTYQRYIWLEPY